MNRRIIFLAVFSLSLTSYAFGYYSGSGQQIGDMYYYRDNQGGSYTRQTIGNFDYVSGTSGCSQQRSSIIILPPDPYMEQQAKAGEACGLALAGCVGLLLAQCCQPKLTYEERMKLREAKLKRRAERKSEQQKRRARKQAEKEQRRSERQRRKEARKAA